MLMFICYINLKYIGANYVLLKPGAYTPTLKKHQVVRDLKKFENHWTRQSSVRATSLLYLFFLLMYLHKIASKIFGPLVM